MAEYFGGILAASRSPDGVDDKGVAWAGPVSRLSSDDVYVHYLIYEAFRRVYLDRDIGLAMGMVLNSSLMSPRSVEASPMRSGDARDTTEVRPRVP